jgi:hypothetical protein
MVTRFLLCRITGKQQNPPIISKTGSNASSRQTAGAMIINNYKHRAGDQPRLPRVFDYG